MIQDHKNPYSKPILKIQEQIDLYKQRDLIIDNEDEWRVCAICKIYKLRSEFERARFQKWTRRSYRCKECKKDYIEEYKKKWGNK